MSQATSRTDPARSESVAAESEVGEPVATQPDVVARPGATRQLTGDQAVDDVLGQLDQVADEPLDIQIEVSERVHRVLQGRLADLGQE
ncbi:MAG: hypothetical protein ABI903_17685 [Actinomycetota bacterium]